MTPMQNMKVLRYSSWSSISLLRTFTGFTNKTLYKQFFALHILTSFSLQFFNINAQSRICANHFCNRIMSSLSNTLRSYLSDDDEDVSAIATRFLSETTLTKAGLPG